MNKNESVELSDFFYSPFNILLETFQKIREEENELVERLKDELRGVENKKEKRAQEELILLKKGRAEGFKHAYSITDHIAKTFLKDLRRLAKKQGTKKYIDLKSINRYLKDFETHVMKKYYNNIDSDDDSGLIFWYTKYCSSNLSNLISFFPELDNLTKKNYY